MKRFKIYQIKDEAENARYIKFSDMEMLEHLGLKEKLSLDLYENVYEGNIDGKDDFHALEGLYRIFNFGDRPKDFKGHSLSVSDVVELDGKFYYCDSYGWLEVFKNKEAA